MSTAARQRPPVEQSSDTGDRLVYWIIASRALVVPTFFCMARNRHSPFSRSTSSIVWYFSNCFAESSHRPR